jgi:uncharacterized protein YgbK (DUF1537 family)
VRPFGLAATLHDALALAQNFGPGARISFGAPDDGTDIWAPRAVDIPKIPGNRPRCIFAFGAGNTQAIAPMIDALAAATGTGFMAACLAAPWAGLTMYQGHLFQDGRLLANLMHEFSMALQGGAGLVTHSMVAAGAGAIRRQCAALKEQGKTLALIDAIDDDDCAAIAEALAGFPLLGGGAWLAAEPHAPAPPEPGGPVAILSGALDRQTVYQMGAARLAMPVFDLDFTRPDPVADALAWAGAKIGAPFIIATTASPDRVTPGAPAAACLAAIARGLVAAKVTRLLVTGNDTARAVIDALAVRELTVGAAFGPLRWLEGEGIALCVKPGGVGAKNLFLSEFEPQIRLNATAE